MKVFRTYLVVPLWISLEIRCNAPLPTDKVQVDIRKRWQAYLKLFPGYPTKVVLTTSTYQ